MLFGPERISGKQMDKEKDEVVYIKAKKLWTATRNGVSGGEFSSKKRALEDLQETERFKRIAGAANILSHFGRYL